MGLMCTITRDLCINCTLLVHICQKHLDKVAHILKYHRQQESVVDF